MQIKEMIKKGATELKVKGIENANLKARLLMQYYIKKSREYIIAHDEEELTRTQIQEYKKGIEELINGLPLQYITHSQEFMKMTFYVNENVLIPRPDTEILVEEVINISKNMNNIKILDMCTGSGAIAISLAKYIRNSEVTAVDISEEALRVAKLNAKNNMVADNITFIKSNLFDKVVKQKYDMIVSNPPYIKKEIIKTLSREVQKEPRIALDGGKDGLEFYRRIISHSFDYLKYNGYLCIEIGYDQKEEVINIIKKEEKYSNVYCKKDLAGNDRVIVARSQLERRQKCLFHQI